MMVRLTVYLDPAHLAALQARALDASRELGSKVSPGVIARGLIVRGLGEEGGGKEAAETIARAVEAARKAGATPEVIAALRELPLSGGLDLAALIVFERADAAREARFWTKAGLATLRAYLAHPEVRGDDAHVAGVEKACELLGIDLGKVE